MFKRIKRYLQLQKRIQHEILETLCTICLYLEYEGQYGKNRYAQYMQIHFAELKQLSEELRGGGESGK